MQFWDFLQIPETFVMTFCLKLELFCFCFFLFCNLCSGAYRKNRKFVQLQVAIVDVSKMMNSTISTPRVYLCNLSLPLSNTQCHLHSSHIPSEVLAVLLYIHSGIQPHTWYQTNNRNLPDPARHLEAGPRDYIEGLRK